MRQYRPHRPSQPSHLRAAGNVSVIAAGSIRIDTHDPPLVAALLSIVRLGRALWLAHGRALTLFGKCHLISTANITMQFGAKPLFENISVKFGGGNRYGLIGANGSGKSTLMKILGGDLQPSSGNVSVDANERLGKLRQDQFAFENYTVLDTVIMGHAELWQVMQERDRIYSLAHMSEEDGMAVAELEVELAEHDLQL